MDKTCATIVLLHYENQVANSRVMYDNLCRIGFYPCIESNRCTTDLLTVSLTIRLVGGHRKR